MTNCPNCQAEGFAVLSRHVQKTATVVGGVAGSLRGISSALAEPEQIQGHDIGGRRLHIIANAIVGGFRGGANGCAIGAIVGETIKQSLTNTYLCSDCGHSFD